MSEWYNFHLSRINAYPDALRFRHDYFSSLIPILSDTFSLSPSSLRIHPYCSYTVDTAYGRSELLPDAQLHIFFNCQTAIILRLLVDYIYYRHNQIAILHHLKALFEQSLFNHGKVAHALISADLSLSKLYSNADISGVRSTKDSLSIALPAIEHLRPVLIEKSRAFQLSDVAVLAHEVGHYRLDNDPNFAGSLRQFLSDQFEFLVHEFEQYMRARLPPRYTILSDLGRMLHGQTVTFRDYESSLEYEEQLAHLHEIVDRNVEILFSMKTTLIEEVVCDLHSVEALHRATSDAERKRGFVFYHLILNVWFVRYYTRSLAIEIDENLLEPFKNTVQTGYAFRQFVMMYCSITDIVPGDIRRGKELAGAFAVMEQTYKEEEARKGYENGTQYFNSFVLDSWQRQYISLRRNILAIHKSQESGKIYIDNAQRVRSWEFFSKNLTNEAREIWEEYYYLH